jgi:archaellum component FlaC
MLEKEIYKLGEKMNKSQVKKFARIEKSLTDNIAMIESILEGLKSDFNYIKNMPDCSVEKEKVVNIDFNASIPSFVEVVERLERLEKYVKCIDEKLSFVARKIND